MTGQPYLVRQHAGEFVVFVLLGILFCVFPWVSYFTDADFPTGFGTVAMLLGFPLMGCLAIVTGVAAWKISRVGLTADRDGIWMNGGTFGIQKTLIPWDDMRNVKKVAWTSPEGEHEGVLIDLKEHAVHPYGEEWLQNFRKQMERWIGPVEYPKPLMLSHDEWDWRIDEFTALVARCIHDPAAREALGEFRSPDGSPTEGT